MKITYLEIEASKEELASCNTLADGLTNALRRVLDAIAPYNIQEEENE